MNGYLIWNKVFVPQIYHALVYCADFEAILTPWSVLFISNTGRHNRQECDTFKVGKLYLVKLVIYTIFTPFFYDQYLFHTIFYVCKLSHTRRQSRMLSLERLWWKVNWSVHSCLSRSEHLQLLHQIWEQNLICSTIWFEYQMLVCDSSKKTFCDMFNLYVWLRIWFDLHRNFLGGWPAFVASLLVIAGLTALVEQVILLITFQVNLPGHTVT